MQLDMFESPDDVPYHSDHSNLTMIARKVFRYEITEALKVMSNIGVLHTEEQRLWCLREVGRLLDEVGPDNLT